MQLEKLKKSVSDMSTEELMETFRSIRHSRANPPAKKTKAKSTAKKKKPTRKSVLQTIDDLSPEQIDELMAKLKEQRG